jgi:4-hydroxybenzoate polyprenyltransferase
MMRPAPPRRASFGAVTQQQRVLRNVVGAIRLLHPYPLSVVVATSVVMVVIAHHGSPGAGFIARVFGVVLISQVVVGALNDYVDRDQDAITQPDKPIPSGQVSPNLALALTLGPLILMLPLAASFGTTSLYLVCLGTASALVYDLWLKPTPFSLLSYLVSFLSLVTWIWVIAGRITAAFLLVYPAGCMALFAAHLANSFPDVETDRARGEMGLAALLGPVWTLRAIFMAYLVVDVAGVAVAIGQRRPAAIGLLAVATTLGLAAWLLCRRAAQQPSLRDRLFWIVAPGVGIMALGCLLAINPA